VQQVEAFSALDLGAVFEPLRAAQKQADGWWALVFRGAIQAHRRVVEQTPGLLLGQWEQVPGRSRIAAQNPAALRQSLPLEAQTPVQTVPVFPVLPELAPPSLAGFSEMKGPE
jgi:hypothetical protein